MLNTKQFRFDYPVTDNNQSPAKHFTDLSVVGEAEMGRHNKVLNVNITRMWFKSTGDLVSSDVKRLIEVTSKDLHNEICEAALQHAIGKFEEEMMFD